MFMKYSLMTLGMSPGRVPNFYESDTLSDLMRLLPRMASSQLLDSVNDDVIADKSFIARGGNTHMGFSAVCHGFLTTATGVLNPGSLAQLRDENLCHLTLFHLGGVQLVGATKNPVVSFVYSDSIYSLDKLPAAICEGFKMSVMSDGDPVHLVIGD